MRPSLPASPIVLAALVAVLAVFVAGCTSAAPGWTYAPPTEAPSASPAASGETPAPPASETPASGAPAPSDGGAGGVVIEQAAVGVNFVNKELSAPADTPFTIRFDNQDAGVPHDIEIRDASGASVFKGELFTGVAVKDYQVPALAAGTYPFVCTVHPNMVGTLTVGG